MLTIKMKTILFSSICLLFFTQVHSQTLSAKELVNLSDRYSKTDFLKSRSFTNTGSNVNSKTASENFAKNTGTAKQETIFIIGNTISYLTRSKAFITNLLAQLQHQYKQSVKDADTNFTYYQFSAGDGKNISVNVAKSANNYHSMVIMQK